MTHPLLSCFSQEYILDTLHFCMRLDQVQALIAGAMEVFTELLLHNSPIIRAKAARDIMDLRSVSFSQLPPSPNQR